MKELKIGVLDVQGDVAENVYALQQALQELNETGKVVRVKTSGDIAEIDGIVIPGGESTMIGQMSLLNGSLRTIKERINDGMPAFGICAGLILLSKNVVDKTVGKTDQPLLDILDVKIERNSFGRQKDSFEGELDLNSIGIPSFTGVFIRAPTITDVGTDVEVLSKFEDKVVAVKQRNVLGTSFHPELTNNVSIHKFFVNLIIQANLN